MRGVVFAIDYDDTISLDVATWKAIIKILHAAGAVVYIVTYRESTRFDDMELDIPFVKDVLFTGNRAKRDYCLACGIEVDIWIDDCPGSVLFDASELIKHLPVG